MPTRQRFLIELRDAGGVDDSPVIHRLRSLLKACLRSWGLRCTRAVELPNDQDDGEQTAPVQAQPTGENPR
jgi:hypothetical protein